MNKQIPGLNNFLIFYETFQERDQNSITYSYFTCRIEDVPLSITKKIYLFHNFIYIIFLFAIIFFSFAVVFITFQNLFLRLTYAYTYISHLFSEASQNLNCKNTQQRFLHKKKQIRAKNTRE